MMDKRLILIIMILPVVSFLQIYFSLKPFIWEEFNLSTNEAANIGNTIGGITAPILAFASVVLLYLTLQGQIKSSNFHRSKNDADIAFLLYNQLEIEFRELTSRSGNPDELDIRYGFDAFKQLCDAFRSDPSRFGQTNESSKILSIIQSYVFVQSAVLQLSAQFRDIIEKKIYSFYILKLRDPLANLSWDVRDNKDSQSVEIVDFFQRMEMNRDPDFDIVKVKEKRDLFSET